MHERVGLPHAAEPTARHLRVTVCRAARPAHGHRAACRAHRTPADAAVPAAQWRRRLRTQQPHRARNLRGPLLLGSSRLAVQLCHWLSGASASRRPCTDSPHIRTLNTLRTLCAGHALHAARLTRLLHPRPALAPPIILHTPPVPTARPPPPPPSAAAALHHTRRRCAPLPVVRQEQPPRGHLPHVLPGDPRLRGALAVVVEWWWLCCCCCW